MSPQIAASIYQLLHQLTLSVWLGGLVYLYFVLPSITQQRALPPLFVRMLGLMRFRYVNLVCLLVMLAIDGVLPFFWTPSGVAPSGSAQAAKFVLYLVCLISSIQLNGFLATAMAVDQAQPVPRICDEDPSVVDKLLRQIQNVTRSVVYCAFVIAVISILQGTPVRP